MDTPHNGAEPPDRETLVEHALEHLKNAEHDLEQADFLRRGLGDLIEDVAAGAA